MPSTVTASFEKFIENISLTGDHNDTATGRRDNIVALLKSGFAILEAFATGSIMRGTALKSVADVDVMVALHYGKHIKDKSPKAVLESVRAQLSEYNAQMAKKNGQAVTLYFKTWPNVDIVPASRVTKNGGTFSHYEIPDMNRNIWLQSNPKKHDASMNALSIRDRQRVRMVKTWNEAHSAYMQSFHIEVIALSTPVAEQYWPQAVFRYFETALAGIDAPLSHPNGASGRVDDYLITADRKEVRDRLQRAKDIAYEAWDAAYKHNHEKAIERYRVLFGDRFPAYG